MYGVARSDLTSHVFRGRTRSVLLTDEKHQDVRLIIRKGAAF